jgi:predicted ATP-dependent serine protease
MRAERLSLNKDNIRLLSSVSLEEVLATLEKIKPKLVGGRFYPDTRQ